MAYWERNTLILGLASMLGGAFYFGIVTYLSLSAGAIIMPNIWIWLGYIILQVAMSMGGILLVGRNHLPEVKDLHGGEDERDRIIRNRSEAMNGHLAAAFVFACLALWFWHQSPALLFHSIVAAMILGEVGRCLFQFYSYNRAY
ncbi:MAG: hypothetical protein AAFZ91_00640 [Pseudomonadota bacterium]